MSKKTLLLLFVTVLLASVSFLVYLLIERVNHKRLARQNVATISDFPLLNFDSTRLHISSNRKTILVYFDSECNHCQQEFNEIIQNKNSFKDSDVVIASSELISTIKGYAEKNCPADLDNIHFAKINTAHAYDTFGSLAVPQIFIYGPDGNLIKEFKGETRIEAILYYL